MHQQFPKPDPSVLAPGWVWANWDGAGDSLEYWKGVGKISGRMRARFDQITVTEGQGKRLHHTLAYYDGPIGFAKVVQPSPGLRAMYFRDGDERCVTHFNDKANEDHDTDTKTALDAREQHFDRKSKKKR